MYLENINKILNNSPVVVSLKKYLVRVKYILPGGTGILNQVLLLLFDCLSGTSVFRRIIPDSCFLAGVSLRHFLQLGLLIFTSNNIGLSGEMCSWNSEKKSVTFLCLKPSLKLGLVIRTLILVLFSILPILDTLGFLIFTLAQQLWNSWGTSWEIKVSSWEDEILWGSF